MTLYEQYHWMCGQRLFRKWVPSMGSCCMQMTNLSTVFCGRLVAGTCGSPVTVVSSQQTNPAIRKALMQVLPFLTFGVPDSMHTLLNYFRPYLDFDKFDSEHSSEVTLYLDCFTAVTSGIGVSWGGCMYTGVSWGGCMYTGVSWGECMYTGVSWGGSMYTGVSWGGCMYTGVSWGGSMYTGVSWGGCMYTGVSWGGCMYTGVSWGECTCTG